MTAKQFLRSKGILKEGNNQWIVKFEDGKEVDIIDLLEEFKDDGRKLQAVIRGEDLFVGLKWDENIEKEPRKTFQERLNEELQKAKLRATKNDLRRNRS